MLLGNSLFLSELLHILLLILPSWYRLLLQPFLKVVLHLLEYLLDGSLLTLHYFYDLVLGQLEAV